MSNVATIPTERRSILETVSRQYGMEPAAFEATLRATVAKNVSKEEFAACLVVANEYRLNPLLKEVYFFPAKGGGIVPVVGIDGWMRIMNGHPQFDGAETSVEFGSDGKPISATATVWRKDRSRPIVVTEYYSECQRPTEPWKNSPARMLRHKAMIQAARYAFGFAGIYDEDDGMTIAGEIKNVTPTPPAPAPMRAIEQTVGRAAAPPPPPPARAASTIAEELDDVIPDHDQQTGEIIEDGPSAVEAAILDEARAAAMEGSKRLKFWRAKRTAAELAFLKEHDEVLDAAARQVDEGNADA